jgi:hypothetical protein
MSGPPSNDDDVLARTRAWLEQAVIGLELCPFAKAVHARGRIRWVVSDANDPEALRVDLRRELELLAAAPIDDVETTLLLHPRVLKDFLDYNDFLDVADGEIEDLGLEGVLQVASFHPGYVFAGSDPDAVENATNRSPVPLLHLLREESIDRAVQAYPDPDAIVSRNLETLRRLGPAGWRALAAAWLAL